MQPVNIEFQGGLNVACTVTRPFHLCEGCGLRDYEHVGGDWGCLLKNMMQWNFIWDFIWDSLFHMLDGLIKYMVRILSTYVIHQNILYKFCDYKYTERNLFHTAILHFFCRPSPNHYHPDFITHTAKLYDASSSPSLAASRVDISREDVPTGQFE